MMTERTISRPRRRTAATIVLAASLALTSATGPTVIAASGPEDETGTWFDGLDTGICFDQPVDAEGYFDLGSAPQVVPCEGLHDIEVVARVAYDADEYPGEDIEAISRDLCAPRYESFLGRPIESALPWDLTVYPDPSDWEAGVRDAVCAVFGNEPLTGTAASGDLRLPGARIAAVGEVDGRRDIFLVDAADGSVDPLTADDPVEFLAAPAWTPDGSAVAFAVLTGEDTSDIHLAPLDGGSAEVLVSRPGTNDGPAISPDGSALAYISNAEAPESEIYAQDLASGATTRLTTFADRDTSPQWSPDGSRIAFRRRTDGRSDIWVMTADGSAARKLTDNGANNYDPRWSPDGSQLLFTTDVAGNYDIWRMNADGSDAAPVTTHPADDEYPAWSPDGQVIAFHSSRHGGVSLWLMRADGADESELTGISPLGYPSFAPATD